MPMPAGDFVYSLESISIDYNNVVTFRTATSVVGANDTRQPLRSNAVRITPSSAQTALINALRDALLASLVAAPPPELVGQTNVAPKTTQERQAERDAA